MGMDAAPRRAGSCMGFSHEQGLHEILVRD